MRPIKYFKQIKQWSFHKTLGFGMRFLLKYYLAFILLSIIYKIIFLTLNHEDACFTVGDYAAILLHGLRHDFAVAGYFTAIPLLLTMADTFMRLPLRFFYKAYNSVIALAISLAFIADITLYPYWEQKLDASAVLVYIGSPANVFASVTATHITMLAIMLATLTYAVYRLLSYICKDECTPCKSSSHGIIHKATRSLVYLLVAGLMFLGIRGGTTESTNNIGTVYYNDNATLNDAAVNPIFSFLYTLANLENFKEEYAFYSESEREEIFDGLYVQDNSISDTILNTTRPNIVTIILEGMSAGFVETLGGAQNVTPNIGELANESVLFTECYANSFRTDRGVVSILSGYPSFPKTSVMKDANKSSRLPSLASSLKEAGYSNTFLYGGDIMFTNMNGYLLFTGYDRLISDKDFTREETTTHRWGAGDDITFDRLFDTIMATENEPWHITYLTLSSHEPWEVPYSRIDDDKVANSFAFTDEMLGKFVERLKNTDKWNNTLIICIADHCVTGYPAGIRQSDKERNHILFMMLGGAIKKAKRIDTICNQTDFVATLLAQLQLPCNEFKFSRNILSPQYTYPFAYHCYNNGISLMDSTGYSVYDLNGNIETTVSTPGSENRIKRAKAILQTTYNDFFNL